MVLILTLTCVMALHAADVETKAMTPLSCHVIVGRGIAPQIADVYVEVVVINTGREPVIIHAHNEPLEQLRYAVLTEDGTRELRSMYLIQQLALWDIIPTPFTLRPGERITRRCVPFVDQDLPAGSYRIRFSYKPSKNVVCEDTEVYIRLTGQNAGK